MIRSAQTSSNSGISARAGDFVLDRFRTLMRHDRLAHAYLFIGPKGIGKGRAALAVAQLVNCENPAEEMFCGSCGSCVKIKSGNHPDIKLIDSGGETIKIEQIRQLSSEIQMRAYEAKRKVLIIHNIENLTPESGNALLKTLEEPPPNSLLILTTSVPEDNLDTIKSRCHAVYFFPSSQRTLAARLTKEYAIAQDESHFLAHCSEGYLERARAMNDAGAFDRKNETIDKVILAPDSDAYLKKVLPEKEETRYVLAVLYGWFRDVLLLKSQVDEEYIMNADRLRDLRKSALQYSMEDLRAILKEVVSAAQMLNDNLNIKIPLSLIKERLWRRS